MAHLIRTLRPVYMRFPLQSPSVESKRAVLFFYCTKNETQTHHLRHWRPFKVSDGAQWKQHTAWPFSRLSIVAKNALYNKIRWKWFFTFYLMKISLTIFSKQSADVHGRWTSQCSHVDADLLDFENVWKMWMFLLSEWRHLRRSAGNLQFIFFQKNILLWRRIVS